MQVDWEDGHGSFDEIRKSGRKGKTSMPASPTSIGDLWSALPDLAAEARARSLEFEERRRLAPDFVDKLRRAGVFKVLIPADAGGLGGSLPQWLEIIMTLAEADASTGWVSAHGNICAGLIYASAEPRFRDEFFADPGAYAAWSNLPRVKVKEQDRRDSHYGQLGFRVGMHCRHLRWGNGNAVPARRRRAASNARGTGPRERGDNRGDVGSVGLAGTGSHDVHFDDVFVPWHRTFPWPSGIAVSAYPAAVFVPGTWFITIGAAATHLGLARRALDEARNELRGKTDRYTQRPLLEHPATQRSLEAAEGLWFACRAGMREALAAMWESGLRGEPATADMRINARVAAVTAVQKRRGNRPRCLRCFRRERSAQSRGVAAPFA